jgi:hypothetical protein
MGRNITTSSDSAFITVPTATGFNAGDYVYNQTGGYGRIADNAVATATFPFGVADATNTFQTGGNAQSQVTWVETAGVPKFLGQSAVQLVNGNYVIPYVPSIASNSNAMYPWFRIVDASGNTVVAATQVDNNANNPITPSNPSLGALALPNGNFVIIYRAWGNGVGGVPRMLFRIYNSAGVAQTAVINDATANITSSFNSIPAAYAARSDSSFVLVAYSSDTTTPLYRVYNGTTGATVYSGTWGAGWSDPYGLAVVVRSDNSFVLLQQQSSTLYYNIRNATNTQLAASNISISGYTDIGFSAVLLSGDVVRVVMSGTNTAGTFTITGTTVSAVSLLFTTSGVSNRVNATAASFSSGTKFIVLYNGSTGAPLCYRIFNADGTQVPIAGLSTDTPVRSVPGIVSYSPPNVIETSTTLRVYTPFIRTVINSPASSILSGAGVAYVEINKTTNLVVPAQSAIVSTGSTAPVAVSGYVRATATPTTASFLAASTSVEALTTTAMQQVLPQTVVEATVCDSTQIMGLASGGFAYLYKYGSSPFTIKIAIYNASAVLQSTITVDTGANIRGGARFFAINNGNIIVVYPKTVSNGSGGDTIAFKRYSSTFTELSSGTLVTNAALYTGYQTSGGFAVSPLGPDSRFVLGYMNVSTTQSRYAVFDSIGTLIVAADTGGFSPRGFQVWGTKNGNFGLFFARPGSGNNQTQYYTPATSSTYTQFTSNTGGSANYSWYGVYTEVGPDNGVPLLYNSSSETFFYYISGGELTQGSLAYIPFYQNANAGALQLAVGRTASNITVFAGTDMPGQTAGLLSVAAYSVNPAVSSGTPQVLTALQNISLSCFPASSGGSCPSVAPFANDSCLISLLNTSGFPTFYAVFPYVSTQFSTITGGVSVSNPVSLLPSSRFVLVGVAATTAAASSTGVVQTKGNVQLSSSYSATTAFQGFDFRNQMTFGAAGTVSGRTVVLEN